MLTMPKRKWRRHGLEDTQKQPWMQWGEDKNLRPWYRPLPAPTPPPPQPQCQEDSLVCLPRPSTGHKAKVRTNGPQAQSKWDASNPMTSLPPVMGPPPKVRVEEEGGRPGQAVTNLLRSIAKLLE